jgi:hypothetical protein
LTNLSDAFDTFHDIGGETLESSLKNIVKDAHHWTLEGATLPIHTQYEGIAGDGISGYVDEHYNPNTEGVRFTQNSGAIGIYSRTESAVAKVDTGVRDGTGANDSNLSLIIRNTVDTFVFKVNHVLVTNQIASTSSLGLFIASRTAHNITKPYINKVVGTTSAYESTAPPSYNSYICARNTANTADTFSARQYSIKFHSRGLTQAEVNIITDAIETYMDAKGKGVIA